MSLTDPLSLTISGTANAMPRTSVGQDKSEYRTSDGLILISASHAYGRRVRRVLRVDHAKIAPDPMVPTQNTKVSMSNYIVFDVPVVGYTLADVQAVYTGFKSLFTASSDAVITKLLGGES
jgi:hypothetical protein